MPPSKASRERPRLRWRARASHTTCRRAGELVGQRGPHTLRWERTWKTTLANSLLSSTKA